MLKKLRRGVYFPPSYPFLKGTKDLLYSVLLDIPIYLTLSLLNRETVGSVSLIIP